MLLEPIAQPGRVLSAYPAIMFARMSSLPDLGPEAPSSDLALSWIELQNSQSVVARRQRLNCAPFQSSASGSSPATNSNSSKQNGGAPPAGHRMLAVCCAGRHLRQTGKRGPSSSQRILRHQAMIKAHQHPQPVRGVQQQHPTPDSPMLRPQQPHHPHQHHASTPSTASSSLDPQQLAACIQAASTFSQLQAVCNTFLGHAAFTPQHATLVLSRLHLVRTRPADSLLLLVELLAQLLPAGCSTQEGADHHQQQQQQESGARQSHKHNLSCGEVAAVCWAFARAGYQPAPQLLQQLLQQFWLALGQQQQQQQQHRQPVPAAAAQPAAADAAAPCAHSSSESSTQQQQQQPQPPAPQWPPSDAHEALSTLVAGLAGLGCREAACWQRVRAAVQVSLSDAGPRLPVHALQQLAWGFAAVQGADGETVDALAAALRGRLGELDTPEDLVQSMWSLHLMGCRDGQLFEQAAVLMVQQVRAGRAGSRRSSPVPTAAAAAAGGQEPPAAAKQQGAVLPQLPRATQQQQQPGPGVAVSSSLLAQRLPQQLRQQQQQGWQVSAARESAPQRLLTAAAGQTAALAAAAGQAAFGVLHKYDPLLCMLALYRDYSRPAHGVGSV